MTAGEVDREGGVVSLCPGPLQTPLRQTPDSGKIGGSRDDKPAVPAPGFRRGDGLSYRHPTALFRPC